MTALRSTGILQARRPLEDTVSDHVYRITEVVGSSPDSVQQAIRNGIARVSATVRNVEWFEATEIRGHVADGQIDAFQVTLKVGFRLED
jgi:hypothetical protein